MKAYDFGGAHPLNARRLQLRRRSTASRRSGFWTTPRTRAPAPPRLATGDELLTRHDAEYLEALKRAGATGRPEPTGWGTATIPSSRTCWP